KAHGLVHSIYELYGASYAGQLLGLLGRLLSHYLQFHGFTCGMDDMLLKSDAEKRRKKLTEEVYKVGLVQAGIYTGLIQDRSNDPEIKDEAKKRKREVEDATKIQSDIQEQLMAKVQVKEYYDNWDSLMIGKVSPFTTKIIETCIPSGQVKAFPY